MKLTIDLDDTVGLLVAQSKGWKALIEDTSQPLNGDEYPLIENPVTVEEFLEDYIPEYIKEYVIRTGREFVINNFNSIQDASIAAIVRGDYDNLILSADYDEIKARIIGAL